MTHSAVHTTKHMCLCNSNRSAFCCQLSGKSWKFTVRHSCDSSGVRKTHCWRCVFYYYLSEPCVVCIGPCIWMTQHTPIGCWWIFYEVVHCGNPALTSVILSGPVGPSCHPTAIDSNGWVSRGFPLLNFKPTTNLHRVEPNFYVKPLAISRSEISRIQRISLLA